MTIQELQSLRDSGQFHHATYRERGSIWEGLYIYAKAVDGFRGYKLAGCFNRDSSPDLQAAEAIVRGTGVSVDSYGKG